jgi:hypothetical protein
MAAFCLSTALPAWADEWVLDRTISARASYNDNLNMQVANRETSSTLALTPSLTLSDRTERSDSSVAFAATVNRFQERPEFNTTDYRATLSLKSSSELDQRSLTVVSLRDSTLASELATTGVVLARRQRTQTTLQASWQRSVTERLSATAGLSMVSTRFEPTPGVVDFTDQTLSAGLRRTVSDSTSFGLTLSSRDFQTATDSVKSRTNAFSISGQWRYSERLRLTLDVGRDRTRTDQQANALACPLPVIFCQLSLVPFQAVVVPVSSTTNGTSFNALAAYEFETGSATANLGRSLNASGIGSLLRSEQATLNYQRRLSDTLEFGFGASTVRSQALDGGGSEVRLSRLSPSLQWKIDPQITLTGGYTYLTQVASGQAERARGNTLFVNLVYGFKPASASK